MTRSWPDGAQYSYDQQWELSCTPSVEPPPLHDADLPIHKAAYKGDITRLSILVPSNINARSIFKITPLQLAIRGDQAEAARILLSAGADPDLEDDIEPCYYLAFNAINAAAWLGKRNTLQALIDSGVQVLGIALSWAASVNQIDCVRTIVEKLGQCEFKDMTRLEGVRMALVRAALCWHAETVDFLLTQVEGFPNKDDTDDQIALSSALVSAVTEFDCDDRCRWNGVDQLSIMQRLIAAGANINMEHSRCQPRAFWTLLESPGIPKGALLFLLENGLRVDGDFEEAQSPLFSIVTDNDDDTSLLQAFLDAGATVTVTDTELATPLHYVVHLSLAKLLHKHGADLFAKDKHGRTPLHTASEHWRIDVVDFLLANGANINEPDIQNGWTPLLFATCESCNFRTSDLAHHTSMVKLLIDHGASIQAAAFDNRTPLHGTAHLANFELAQYLVQHGTSVKATTSSGETPLHSVCDFAIHCGSDIAERCRIANMLLDHGADIEARDETGATPLHAAWSCAHYLWGFSPDLFNLLLDRGANRFAKNAEGKTAADLVDGETWMWNDEGKVVERPKPKPVYLPYSRRGRGRGCMGTRGQGRGGLGEEAS